MAHTKQAQKRIKQDQERNAANRADRSELRGIVKTAEQTIAAGNPSAIPGAFQAVMSALHRAARRNLISRGAADRKLSRLAARVSKLNANVSQQTSASA